MACRVDRSTVGFLGLNTGGDRFSNGASLAVQASADAGLKHTLSKMAAGPHNDIIISWPGINCVF